MSEKLASWLPVVINILLTVLPVLLTWAVVIAVKAINAWLAADGREKHRKQIVAIASAAYWVVEQIARKTPGDVDDKVAAALKEIADQLGRELSGEEKRLAVSTLQATHEQRKASLCLADLPAGKNQIGHA
jgi:hypothetical protein